MLCSAQYSIILKRDAIVMGMRSSGNGCITCGWCWRIHLGGQRQSTDDFKTRYRLRAGVEGPISQTAHALELRRARYRGLTKTHFQGLITAVAINLTRQSHFAALAA